MNERTLCLACASNYEDAGFIVIKIRKPNEVADECELCRNRGWAFAVYERVNEKRLRDDNQALPGA